MTAYSQTNLVTQKVLSNTVSISIPESFSLLSKEVIARKYPSGNRPTVVYGNATATINLLVNHTQDAIEPDELPDAFEGFSMQFEEVYPGIEWYTKEIQKINGKEFIVLEFQTPARDTKIYNLMFMTRHQGRLLIFSFNCTEMEKEKWQPVANEILQSVKVL